MFTYYDSLGAILERNKDSHIASIPPGIVSKRDLLETLAEKLSFPSYFGGNFDALWDCLRTLDGIREYSILLVHEDLPRLDGESLLVYIEILYETLMFWEDHTDEHKLEIAFPEAVREQIQKLMKW